MTELIEEARHHGDRSGVPEALTKLVLELDSDKAAAALPSLTEYLNGLTDGDEQQKAVELLSARMKDNDALSTEIQAAIRLRSNLDRLMTGDGEEASRNRVQAALQAASDPNSDSPMAAAFRAGDAIDGFLNSQDGPPSILPAPALVSGKMSRRRFAGQRSGIDVRGGLE